MIHKTPVSEEALINRNDIPGTQLITERRLPGQTQGVILMNDKYLGQ